MADVTITLTDTQVKSLEYAAVSVQDWIQTAANGRAQIAKEEIIAKLVAHCNQNDIALAVGEDAQVNQAYDLSVVSTASSSNSPDNIE